MIDVFFVADLSHNYQQIADAAVALLQVKAAIYCDIPLAGSMFVCCCTGGL
jgi:hypothetical protein